MSDREVKLSPYAKDYTGLQHGRITVTHLHSKVGYYYMWAAKCSCGNDTIVNSRDLSIGRPKSCGCLLKEHQQNPSKNFTEKNKTHGLSHTREYNAWKRVKGRVTNPQNPDYGVYSKLGIDEDFKEDFPAFLEEMGYIPDERSRWSVGRIDNRVGYVRGNIRWERDSQQCKNKGMSSLNKTGVTGVSLRRKGTEENPKWAYIAGWSDMNQKNKTKSFSINKYGDELAFFMACIYREHQIDLLNLQGAGYAPDHGKAGYNAKGNE